MTTMKILLLAGFAALSLGVGTAMADGPDGTSPDYQSEHTLASATNMSRAMDHGAGPDTVTKRAGIFFDYVPRR
jgi:hypothetical protein